MTDQAQPKQGWRKIRGWLIYILFLIISVSLGLEILLQVFDPLGVSHQLDILYLGQVIYADDGWRGYAIPPGEYPFRNWQITILPDWTRRVPDTNTEADKTLVFVGDSVTFGQAVDDEESWVNLVAEALPEWHVINAGISGQGVPHVRRAIDHFPDADLIVWLTIENDRDLTDYKFRGSGSGRYMNYLSGYLIYFENLRGTYGQMQASRYDFEGYSGQVEEVLQDERVVMFAFDDEFGQQVKARFDEIHLIEKYTTWASMADRHADAAGNKVIADQVLPIIRAHIVTMDD